MKHTALAAATTIVLLASRAAALDNGLGLLPPMGWRNWWSMFGDVSQAKMQFAFEKMTQRRRTAVRPGSPTAPLCQNGAHNPIDTINVI